ncbi:MAG: glycosyltransferase family 4 protein [Ferruginibacter sp.]
MTARRIHIILPFPVTKPVGGAKIMYEYANRLAARGHRVHIFHSIKRPFKKSATPVWIKQWLFALRGVARPRWFPLDARVQSTIVPEITDRYLPDADVVLSTWWQMAFAIHALSPSKGKKFNLIQDYEVWAGQTDNVHASYALPIQHLVIARYLQDLVFEKTGVRPIHIPNAIDQHRFSLTNPIETRAPLSIIMLYSKEPRKGSDYGIRVLERLKETVPILHVVLFGVYPCGENIPSTFDYHQRPNDLAALYNQSALFVSPSLGEGWALPPAEAMACGCAVVCTRIGGHLDYAADEQTALLFEPGNEDDMYRAIERALNDQLLRERIARQGNTLITTSFSWNRSVDMLEDLFY